MVPDLNFRLFPKRCRCPGTRHPPVSIYGPSADKISGAGCLYSSTPIVQIRCTNCKQFVVYTAGDLGLGLVGGLRSS